MWYRKQRFWLGSVTEPLHELATSGRRIERTRRTIFARLCVFAMFDRPMDRGRCVQHDRSAQFRA